MKKQSLATPLDRNGYARSIMPTIQGRCYVCHRNTDTARHEIFYGTANRKNSKEFGTWVDICPVCHADVHANPSEGFDIMLKRSAQWAFEREHTRDEFRKIFGRSWL